MYTVYLGLVKAINWSSYCLVVDVSLLVDACTDVHRSSRSSPPPAAAAAAIWLAFHIGSTCSLQLNQIDL